MKFAALIATSMKRSDLLQNRSLKSVLNQTRFPDSIVVVDDNEDNSESQKIHDILLDYPNVIYLKNTHTHGMSGTGAWNTGIEFIADQLGEDCFVCILDDDDEWTPNHLELCEAELLNNNTAIGIFPWIYRTDINRALKFSTQDLTIDNFLIGDPGIQGSNMIIRASAFLKIGMFDESLPSCTDRDLLLRLLQTFLPQRFLVVPQVSVYHYASPQSITYIPQRKHAGLDAFYDKYLKLFPSLRILQASLGRAQSLFAYQRDSLLTKYMNNSTIAIAVAFHNNSDTITRCLKSIVLQINVRHHIKVVIGDDASTIEWESLIKEYKKSLDIDILHFNHANVVKTRNAINDYIKNLPRVAIIGRLDADDEYASCDVLSRIEQLFINTQADVIIGANGYLIDGKVADYGNWHNEELLNVDYLRKRVKEMAQGQSNAELPSCNLFVLPSALLTYPNVDSAEDHFLTLKYLTLKSLYKTVVTDHIIVTNYSLNGITTKANKTNGTYLQSRQLMLQALEDNLIDNNRILFSKEKLKTQGIENLSYLGVGQEGVVFHDNLNVYKVFTPLLCEDNPTWLSQRLLPFTHPNMAHSKHLYQIQFITDSIICYKYEKSQPCLNYSIEEIISFITECWQYKTLIKDCKPKNFIRVDGVIKLVDMKGYDYTDNLFLNMAARMYLYARFGNSRTASEMRKLTRSAINNFDIPELADNYREFINKLYANIIYEESKSALISHQNIGTLFEQYPFEELPNLEELYFSKLRSGLLLKDVTYSETSLSINNYFRPKTFTIGYTPLLPTNHCVSLLIKCCPQDVPTLKANIKHIVHQLCHPEPFCEVVLGIDPYAGPYLRQYNQFNSLENLLTIAKELQFYKIIDRYVVFPDTEALNLELSKRWFGIESKYSHTEDLKPITSQLFALESCKGDYILQMDSDVLIGRKDDQHCFLSEMVEQLILNKNVVSVGFNIPNSESKPYHGFDNGGFVPEVRLGLFDKQRLFAARPFPNKIDANGKLVKSWFRALEQKQKQSGLCSIRGGDMRTFYIHPQNYRKAYTSGWMPILDRVEQGYLPACQVGEFDCAGSLMEWCSPKRNEDVVVVSVFRNVRYDRFLRFWSSLISQTDKDFGIILYDDASDNGLPIFIDSLIHGYENRITFIKGRTRATRMENEYKCIHNYMSNQQSVVVLVDGDDALIGSNVIQQIHNRYSYWQCDVIVGRLHQTYRIQPHYRYPVDFQNPRKTGGNVWQHIKSFKKYLFDSVPLNYFIHENSLPIKWRRDSWLETVDDFAMMVPIAELALKPLQMDIVNYYYERDFEHRNDDQELKEKLIGEILNKPALKSGDFHIGRRTFQPQFDKIEIDITYDCNLRCHGCNRSCGLAPTKAAIRIDQIHQFVAESIKLGIKWTLINILGGEPTLHKKFLEIIRILKQDYKDSFSPNTTIQVVSNGYTEYSRSLCEEAKNHYGVIIDYGSYKTNNKIDYFTPFNDAPIDHEQFVNTDFTKGCWVAKYCGINLNCNGYFACSICGANDRVIGQNKGVSSLKELTKEKIAEQMDAFCRYCGNFSEYDENFGDNTIRCEKRPFKEIISKSWQEIYKNYNSKKK